MLCTGGGTSHTYPLGPPRQPISPATIPPPIFRPDKTLLAEHGHACTHIKFSKENYKMQTTANVHSYKVLSLMISCYPHINNKSVIHFMGLQDHKLQILVMFVVYIQVSGIRTLVLLVLRVWQKVSSITLTFRS